MGSKRIPHKNTKQLGGRPLLWWTVDLALACDLFGAIIVSTDLDYWHADERVDRHDRKPEHATDDAPDYLWVQDVMKDRTEEIFCILRPTSPFRTQSTIRRAYARLIGSGADSVRAVERVKQHPGKMWSLPEGSKYLQPLINTRHLDGTPWHSSPTQTLPQVYAQNASLEMAWTRVLQTGTISGVHIAPFLTEPLEGFDINTIDDWHEAERIATSLAETTR